jgi:alkylation response protein AidB-like acyl-CoA dehydrogenase
MLKPSLNAVQDVVRAHADDTGDKRRLPDSVVEVLRESGFNRLAIPATLGGREAPLIPQWRYPYQAPEDILKGGPVESLRP